MTWTPQLILGALAVFYGGLAIRHKMTNGELGVTGKIYMQQAIIFCLVAIALFFFL